MASISVQSYKIIEGKLGDSAKMQFIVMLSAPVSHEVKVDYATSDLTAKAGLDYTANTGTLSIKAGDLSGLITVDILGDAIKEGDETFNLTLSAPVGAGFAKGTTLATTGTIQDDEKTISLASAKFLEGKVGDKGEMQFIVSLSEAATQDVKVAYKTADSTAKNAAKAGVDYTAATGTLEIKAGDTTGVIKVEILGDALKEGDEIFNLNLSAPEGAGFAKGTTLAVVGTITDDEKNIAIAAAKQIEGKATEIGQMQFVVTLNEVAAQDVTVAYATADSTAKAGVDYTATSGTLEIKAGQTSGVINVEVLGDGLKEGDEIFNLILSSPVGAGFVKGTTLSAIGTIQDDEKTISITGAKLIEGKAGVTSKMNFVVSLNEAASQDVTLAYATSDSTAKNAAKAGVDYTAISNILEIKAGETSGVISVDILGDALWEGDEIFNLTLSSPTGAGFAKGTTLATTGTILDDEQTISIAGAKLIEGKLGETAKMNFIVKLSQAASQNVTVDYATSDSTAKNAAKAGVDYSATSNTLTILAGDTTGVISVDVKGDALWEGDEIFNLTLASPVGAGFAKGTTLAATGTILDDELSIVAVAPGGVQSNDKSIAVAAGRLIEGKVGETGKMQFVVSLNNAIGQDISFAYATSDSSAKNAAKAGVDYTATSGTLEIKAGQTSGVINVNILGDALKEGDEIFNLTLSSPVGAGFAKGADLVVTGTIQDDEKTISVAPARLIEGKTGETGKMNFVVSLNEAASQDVTLAYATSDSTAKNAAKAGLDYTAITNTLTIKAGDTAGVITVDILGDALKEGDEIFNLTLSSLVGAGFAKGESLLTTGSITDDEKTISLTGAKLIEGKAGETSKMNFIVSLNEAASQDVTVAYETSDSTAKNAAKAGVDYTLAKNTVTILAGETSAVIGVDILGDALWEGDEIFNLTLSSPVGAGFAKSTTLSATGTILNDEKTLSIAPGSLIEGKVGDTGKMLFTVSLNEAAAQDVEVAYATVESTAKNAAKSDVDYTKLSGVLKIAAGATSGVISVDILGDAIKEDNEIFQMELSAPVGAGFAKGTTLSTSGTIVDDEKTLSIVGAKLIEGKTGETGKMQFVVSLSEAATQDVTVAYLTSDSTAKNAAKVGVDYKLASDTLTIKAGEISGVINVDVFGDAIKEGDEIFNLTLSAPVGAGFAKGTTLATTGIILDDEKTISVAPAKLLEGKVGQTSQMNFLVSLNEIASQDVKVVYVTSDSTAKNAAKAGMDYTLASNTLTIKAGDTAGVISVDILGDALMEGDEIFNLTLSSPEGAGFAKGTTLVTTGTILDDEKTLSIATAKLSEGKTGDVGKMNFVVSLNAAAAQDVTVVYATSDSTAKNTAKAGDDYTAASGTLEIKAGATSGLITVDIRGDALKEGDEIFNLTLSEPLGAGFAKGTTLATIGTILDDEKTLSITSAKLIEGKGGDTGKMQFAVTLSEAAAQDVTVAYATSDSTAKNAAKAGVDYTAKSGPLEIKAGQTSGIISVDILGDGLMEGDEIFNLILSAPVGAGFAKGTTLSTTGTIQDDEKTISIATAKLLEGKATETGKMQFLVALSGVAGQDVKVTYATSDSTAKNAAKAGEDYTVASGTLEIKAGDISGLISVDILGDAKWETDEVFNLTLSAPEGAGFAKGVTVQVVGTILNDEPIISFF